MMELCCSGIASMPERPLASRGPSLHATHRDTLIASKVQNSVNWNLPWGQGFSIQACVTDYAERKGLLRKNRARQRGLTAYNHERRRTKGEYWTVNGVLRAKPPQCTSRTLTIKL